MFPGDGTLWVRQWRLLWRWSPLSAGARQCSEAASVTAEESGGDDRACGVVVTRGLLSERSERTPEAQ